jgi:hypothetical protein
MGNSGSTPAEEPTPPPTVPAEEEEVEEHFGVSVCDSTSSFPLSLAPCSDFSSSKWRGIGLEGTIYLTLLIYRSFLLFWTGTLVSKYNHNPNFLSSHLQPTQPLFCIPPPSSFLSFTLFERKLHQVTPLMGVSSNSLAFLIMLANE